MSALVDEMRHNRKITLVGPSGVGKTSLINRIVYDSFGEEKPTMGCAYNHYIIKGDDNETYGVNFWDTAGQEKYSSIIPLYFKDNWLFWLVFDLSNPDSLTELYAHVLNINEYQQIQKLRVYVIGNKKDLLTESFDKNNFKVQRLLTSFFSCKYFEVSAKTGENLEVLMAELKRDLSFKEDYEIIPNLNYNIQQTEIKKKKCC